jgi:predicted RNA-binding Zn-ribbon protein involved in translation (DUF1610 family)
MPRICKKCGYERQEVERVSESECPNCGAIYTKVEARLKREAEELLRQEEQIEKERQSAITRYNKEKEGKKEIIQLDCSACKTKASMKATKIPKFNTILRIIGFIIVIPSVIGVLIAILIFITSIIATATTQSSAGAAIDATISFGFSLFIGCSSLVGGVIGWFLIMERKVYKCINCGFILDRA